MNYVLTCGSTVDLTEEHLNKRNIKYIPFKYYVNDKEYVEDFGKTLPYSEFYQEIRNGANTHTTQVNVEEYKDFFRPFLKDKKDVIYVSLSSGLSGTYNSALLAKKELEEEFPEQKVYVIDSLGASSGSGMLVDTLADLRDKGYSAEDVYRNGEDIKLNLHYLFFSTDLTTYIKGGRISKTSGWIGTMLKICPILDCNAEGKLVPRKKVCGKKRAIQSILDTMATQINDGYNYNDKCYICHSDAIDDANQLKALIEEKYINLKDKIEIYSIGTTIGSHSGPGTLAVFFYGVKREK